MSKVAITKALETRLEALDNAFPTQWENSGYKPIQGVAYQAAYLLFARPENPTFGDDFHRQRGYLQVDLRYPSNAGKAAALLKADQLEKWFPRGLSLERDGITTVIDETPEISGGSNEGDRFVIKAIIRFYANIQPGV